MKRRFAVFILAVLMLFGQILIPGTTVFAAGIKNAYGHTIIYEPVENITTGGTDDTCIIKLFDAGYSAWKKDGNNEKNEAASLKWLSDDKYLLNRFGVLDSSSKALKDLEKGGVWNHFLELKGSHEVKKWTAKVIFPKLTDEAERKKGNLQALYDKGDLEYFFTWKVKTIQTSWWGKKNASNDTGYTEILGRWKKSRGNGWNSYSALPSGGPDFNDNYGWRSAEELSYLYFKAESDVDDQVDSWFSGGMLVARDKQGPKISSIRITSDREGKKPINGPIGFAEIKTLTDRTIYFQVEWDEPVVLSGMSDNAMKKFKLEIDVEGIDGGTAPAAAAAFLEFKPEPDTKKPVMVFEYQIPDPFDLKNPNVQLAVDRGYFYKFDFVKVSSSINKDIWNHVKDISGNRFNATAPYYNVPNEDTKYFSASSWVDIQPFGVEALNMRRTINGPEDKSMFVRMWHYFYIDLCFNKLFDSSVQEADYPKITLNVQENGTPVTLTAVGRGKDKEGKKDVLTYCFDPRWDREYAMVGDSIKVTGISFDASKFKDVSGYSFMNYGVDQDTGILTPQNMPNEAITRIDEYSPSPNAKYKIDFTPPTISLEVDDVDFLNEEDNLTYKIIKVEATIDESVSLSGSSAAFTVKVNGNLPENAKLSYMSTTSGSWNEKSAKHGKEGSLSVSFNAALSQGEIVSGTIRTYGLVKLPYISEVDSVEVSVSVTDEAGNVGSETKTFSAESVPAWSGYDNMAPRVKASVKLEKISVKVDELNFKSYMYAFTDDVEGDDENPPTVFTTVTDENEDTILAPADVLEGGLYSKLAWIKAKDSAGNESELLRLPVIYDRTETKIIINQVDTEGPYGNDEYPSINLTINDAGRYWYVWAEKPAVADPTGYIIANEWTIREVLRNAAESGLGGYLEEIPDEVITGPPEKPNNSTPLNVVMSAETDVLKILSGEKYGSWSHHKANQSSRPIMLVIGAAKDYGEETYDPERNMLYTKYNWLIKTIEFNTMYQPPVVSVTQTRFSTCNSAGERIDYMRNADGTGLKLLRDHEQDSKTLNTPSLFGFAQAEFSIAPDPVTGFDRVDMINSSISLEKVLCGYNDYSGKYYGEVKREVVDSWTFNDLKLTNAPDGSKTAIVDFDPNRVGHEYYETFIDANGKEKIYAVRYEFVSNLSYINSTLLPDTHTAISQYAFCDMPQAFIFSIGLDKLWRSVSDENQKNVEAVFVNEVDMTADKDIPVYYVQTTYGESEAEDQDAYLRFSLFGEDSEGADEAYIEAPIMNEPDKVDPQNNIKVGLCIGTDPKNLGDPLPFTNDDATFAVVSKPYMLNDHLFGDMSEIREVKLYYKFVYPERGTESPLYVFKIRRDNTPPLLNIYASELKNQVPEVVLGVNSFRDTQKGSDGKDYVDTPEGVLRSKLQFEAWRKPTAEDGDLSGIPDEDRLGPSGHYYEAGQEVHYIRVHPDEDDGLYHFTSNGFFQAVLRDIAGNDAQVLVNGESLKATDVYGPLGRGLYYINNVDTDNPAFVTDPTITAGEGKFTISAEAEKTVSKVYLKFDDAYTELLVGATTGGAVRFGMNRVGEVDHSDIPGMISGGFNPEDGTIYAEIYVKHDENIPLSAVTVIIEKESGRRTEFPCAFATPISGTEPKITNANSTAAGWTDYKLYEYGQTLDFSVPVKIVGISCKDYALSYPNDNSDKLAIYSDGLVSVEYTDLFGDRMLEEIYADICGAAFAHSLIFTIKDGDNDVVITPQTPVSADVKVTIDTSKTPNLSVVGQSEFTFTENGKLTYTLKNSETGASREFNVPILNIDKEAPEALVSFSSETEMDDDGKLLYYSVTYSIVGFSNEDDDVTLIPKEEGAAATSSVTFSFDTPAAERTYTFRFRDRAGNIGTYTADASDIEFSERLDRTISSYRLIYQAPSGNSFRNLGTFDSGETVSGLGLVNNAVSVKVEALNAAGDLVPCSISASGGLPAGATVQEGEKLVVFSSESSEDRAVNLTLTGKTNTLPVSVPLPANTIDLTAPTGSIKYEVDPLDADNVRAYLVTAAEDLVEESVHLTGSMIDGTPFKLEKDAKGYYVVLHVNGVGKFHLPDKAGNIGTVPIGVFSIDKDAPEYLGEAWQGIFSATTAEMIRQLIETPTNNSISLFIRFNEQLSGANVWAFKDVGDATELTPTADYVAVESANNTVTVEFKQNCRAKLTVYDLRGNATTLWRPEDGPVKGIDKKAPMLIGGGPTKTVKDNTVTLEYKFDEDVMLLQESKKIDKENYGAGHKDGYKNTHTITFKENGTKFLSFADPAGNVFSDYPLITDIDDLAPTIEHSIDFVGEGKELDGNDVYMAGGWYTSKDVRVLLNIYDDKCAENEITVEVETITKSTQEDPGFVLTNVPLTLKDDFASNETTGDVYHNYNYNVVISRNGFYRIIARDKWGNENVTELNISMIDKSGPIIRITGGTLFVKQGTAEQEILTKIQNNVTAEDLQSGANKPLDVNLSEEKLALARAKASEGVTLNIDMSGVNLARAGTYAAKITATDRLGNVSEKKYTVFVARELYIFKVNGVSVYSGDTLTTDLGRISVQNPSPTARYYYSEGAKTEAQMKYAEEFNPETGFIASEEGYYTILAHDKGRKMYVLYVYAY